MKIYYLTLVLRLPSGKLRWYNLPVVAGDPDSVPVLGRTSREGHGNLLQYSSPERPMDRGTWWLYSLWGSQSGYDWSN